MTKARTKGALRAERKARASADNLPREPNGRIQRPSKALQQAARAAVIEARARALGIWPPDVIRDRGEPEDVFRCRREARMAQVRAIGRYVELPWMGCPAGIAIRGEPDVAALWAVCQMIRSRYEANLRAVCAPRQIATISLMIAPSDADTGATVNSPTYDARSEEERDRDAIAAWRNMGVGMVVEAIVCRDMEPRGFPISDELRRIGGLGRYAEQQEARA